MDARGSSCRPSDKAQEGEQTHGGVSYKIEQGTLQECVRSVARDN